MIILTLSDRIPRQFVVDYAALERLFNFTNKPYYKVPLPHEAATLLPWLYVGLYADAVTRGENWTADSVRQLVHVSQIAALCQAVLPEITKELFPKLGEKKPIARRPGKKSRRPGTSTRS